MTRKHAPLTIPVPGAESFKTADDVAYVWTMLGEVEGWSRTRRPDKHPGEPLLLIPKRASQQLFEAALAQAPDEHLSNHVPGVVLLLGATAPGLAVVRRLREARKAGQVSDLYSVLVSEADKLAVTLRLTPAELLLLAQDQGLNVIRDAIPHLSRGAARVVRQALPDGEQAMGLADLLYALVVEGDQAVIPALKQELAKPDVDEALVAKYVGSLPESLLLTAARNEALTGDEIRGWLDQRSSAEVAFTSASVGELTPERQARFAQHRDPAVHARLGGVPLEVPAVETSVVDAVLARVDDPLDVGPWPLEPDELAPDEWGAHTIARYWDALGPQHPAAEKQLRRLTDLHNRSWAKVGQGEPDPAKIAQADAARVAAHADPLWSALDLPIGESVTLDDVRRHVVLAVAAGTDLGAAITDAVCAAAAAVSPHLKRGSGAASSPRSLARP